MADNVVKVKIVGDISDLEHALGNVKKQIASTFFNPSAFSLNAISLWKLAADGIVKATKYIVDTFRNAGEELKKQGKSILDEAKALGAITEDVAGLKAAANAAGVSTQAYADWPRGETERGWHGHRRWVSGGEHSAWAWVRWRWASAISSVYARRYNRHSR